MARSSLGRTLASEMAAGIAYRDRFIEDLPEEFQFQRVVISARHRYFALALRPPVGRSLASAITAGAADCESSALGPKEESRFHRWRTVRSPGAAATPRSCLGRSLASGVAASVPCGGGRYRGDLWEEAAVANAGHRDSSSAGVCDGVRVDNV